jgi:PAS domain S-box-containing protein
MDGKPRYLRSFLVALFVFSLLLSGLVFLFDHPLGERYVQSIELFLFPTSSPLDLARTYFLSSGILLSLLLALGLFFATTARERASSLAVKLLEDVLSSRELFLTLYRNSPTPYVLISRKGLITFPNEAALRLLGATASELEAKNLFEFFISETEDGQKHLDLIPIRFDRNVPIKDEEVLVRRTDGTLRWVSLSLFPFKTPGGARDGLAALVDITKPKEIDKAKTEFVSLASHQLRTPLAALQWHLELLGSPKLGSLAPEQMKELKTITVGVERLNALIGDFLNVSRLELGTLVANRKTVDLQVLIDKLVEEFSPSIRTKELTVIKDVRVISIVSDERLLQMALGNLISNAVKYTRPHDRITVTAKNVGATMEIVVSDSGLGIPNDEQDKLFTKLFRASNVREEVPDGTGLGLYVVQMAVKVLGGNISFTSREGSGTTFTITLPQ